MTAALTRISPVRALLAAAVAAVMLLAGCSSGGGSGSIQGEANQKGSLTDTNAVSQLAPADRGAPVTLSGTTVTGAPWSMPRPAPGVGVVVNVWGSWCPPCIQEEPALKKAYQQLRASRPGVRFIGIDIKEPPQAAVIFINAHKVPYPSLATYTDAQPLLALQGKAPATPTTLVLDGQGRIAARVLGAVDASTLVGLVQDAIPAAGTTNGTSTSR